MMTQGELEAAKAGAELRVRNLAKALEADRALKWLENYLPPKEATEDRIAILVEVAQARVTHDSNIAQVYLQMAAEASAPAIIEAARRLARRDIERISNSGAS